MEKVQNVSILDCTLRDGGCANDFCFGRGTMRAILNALELSEIEYVELGYLDAAGGSPVDRTSYLDMEALRRNRLLEAKRPHLTYLLMIDYGKFPVDRLPPYSASLPDGIRLCFHQKDAAAALRMGAQIIQKGYRLMLQPMVCTSYSDEEFSRLVLDANRLEGLSAFYVVDSFGSMDKEEVLMRMCQADELLADGVSLGLHTHNNRRLCFPIAEAAFRRMSRRHLIVDSTLAGMGKGAGNLPTEQFAAFLDRENRAAYDLRTLADAARTLVLPLRQVSPWGCREEYELSAKHRLTPSYAALFSRDGQLTMEQVDALLARVPPEKKESFDRKTAEKLLAEFKERAEMPEMV